MEIQDEDQDEDEDLCNCLRCVGGDTSSSCLITRYHQFFEDRDTTQDKGNENGNKTGRNARERNRVRAVSGAFLKLRKIIPTEVSGHVAPTKRLSKLKTLKSAIVYINVLKQMLDINTPMGEKVSRDLFEF